MKKITLQWGKLRLELPDESVLSLLFKSISLLLKHLSS